MAVAATALSACVGDDYDYKGEIEDIKLQLAQQQALINVLQRAVTVTDIQKGKDSFTITFSNGESYTISNGQTPLVTIGENGNWFINGEDTGQPSQGKDGRDGNQYRIEIGSDGYWYINGISTGVKAVGIDGRNGTDGRWITSILENYTYFTFFFSDGSSVDVYKTKYAYISSDRTRGNLVPTAIISLKESYIRPNTLMTASITFKTFSTVRVGRGYSKDGGGYLEITAGQVKVHSYSPSDAVIGTFDHGLSLSGSLYVVIDAGWSGSSVSLYSNGKEYRFDLDGWIIGGAPFVENKGTDELAADLSFFPRDVTSGVWVIGDELVGKGLQQLEADSVSPLADWRPGATAANMLISFANDLAYGNPAYALWSVGLYDAADNGAADGAWMTATKSFMDQCKQRGIIPVLATIPSDRHPFKNEWIRKTSGCRYVDFAASGSNPVDMAYRLLVDLPEISQMK